MTAPKVVNLARMTTSTTGTGTLTLGSAVSGFLSFADAGVSDGDVITYAITDGAASEIGRGTYTASGTTLARTTVLASTNSNSAINLSGSAQVMVTMAAEDINSVYLPDTDDSHTLELVAGSDLTDDRVLTITTGDAARADNQRRRHIASRHGIGGGHRKPDNQRRGDGHLEVDHGGVFYGRLRRSSAAVHHQLRGVYHHGTGC